jgi:hypothetical protein
MHASRDTQQVENLARQIAKKRAEGIPAIPAQPERIMPNGQIVPARPAMPAVTAAQYQAALGETNNALYAQLGVAVLGSSQAPTE